MPMVPEIRWNGEFSYGPLNQLVESTHWRCLFSNWMCSLAAHVYIESRPRQSPKFNMFFNYSHRPLE
jgi:hypothetical protein